MTNVRKTIRESYYTPDTGLSVTITNRVNASVTFCSGNQQVERQADRNEIKKMRDLLDSVLEDWK